MLQLHNVDVTGPILLRIIFAAFLGGGVGLERAVHHKPAGLRANMFICIGAAMEPRERLVAISFLYSKIRKMANENSTLSAIFSITYRPRNQAGSGFCSATVVRGNSRRKIEPLPKPLS